MGTPHNMALLMLLGCLMCNVLLALATLQQPYLSKTLSSPPPKNPNQWTHSVIFEPQLQIQLTRSSYKVTSFLDFQPFIKGFQTVKNYLDNYMDRHTGSISFSVSIYAYCTCTYRSDY